MDTSESALFDGDTTLSSECAFSTTHPGRTPCSRLSSPLLPNASRECGHTSKMRRPTRKRGPPPSARGAACKLTMTDPCFKFSATGSTSCGVCVAMAASNVSCKRMRSTRERKLDKAEPSARRPKKPSCKTLHVCDKRHPSDRWKATSAQDAEGGATDLSGDIEHSESTPFCSREAGRLARHASLSNCSRLRALPSGAANTKSCAAMCNGTSRRRPGPIVAADTA
mmetsp:Transcript_100701/g.291055  ORF Transcript_100701/g.291055 Transcript_100701/m.291055 type:complete len:225 (+) Transcript_100701:1745-2419(+)